ncbi:MAG: response regulator [Bacteroidales bacterium]|nr:response regulator [Bacteroidales bacterium]
MKKILIVDDSNTNVVLLEAILNSRGYKIQTAYNVAEAYNMLEKDRPELILLDLLMPRISGYQFLDQLKQNHETRDIPVIIVSAVNDAQNIQKTMDLGASDYIVKPVDIKVLVNKVEKTLN